MPGDGIRPVETEDFYARGPFSVGAGIAFGLKACRRDDWVVVLDADLALPDHTRPALELAELDKRKLYGIDRMTALGKQTWDAVGPAAIAECAPPVVTPPPLRLGCRIAFPDFGGWAPCGFFQMWNPIGSGVHDYPVREGEQR